MEQKNISTFTKKVKKVFNKKRLNELGKEVGLLKRERKITPYRLALGLLSALSRGKVEALADLQRSFNELFNENVAYKPFHNQLAKPEFANFMRELAHVSLEDLTLQVLGFENANAFSIFEKIMLQDGTSFAVHSKLKKIFKGRFTKKNPAAVEIHATLNLFNGSVEHATLTSDSASERAELPLPELLTGCLLLADRGYPDLQYFRELNKQGGYFIMRYQTGINPLINKIFSPSGEEMLTQYEGKTLKEIVKRLPKKKSCDLEVEWMVDGEALKLRLIVTWNKKTKEYQYLITNVCREQLSVEQIILAYKLRWQVELLFKEWKSYANLHYFNTEKDSIVEGLVWASIVAATLKRYSAHIAQIEMQTEISTHKAAKSGHRFFEKIIDALIYGGSKKIQRAIEEFINFLMNNAKRSHPKRDRCRGRLQTGLRPIFSILKN